MSDQVDQLNDDVARAREGGAGQHFDQMETTEEERRHLAETTTMVGACPRCKFPLRQHNETGYVFEDVGGYCSRGCAQETPSADHLFDRVYRYGPATDRRRHGMKWANLNGPKDACHSTRFTIPANQGATIPRVAVAVSGTYPTMRQRGDAPYASTCQSWAHGTVRRLLPVGGAGPRDCGVVESRQSNE